MAELGNSTAAVAGEEVAGGSREDASAIYARLVGDDLGLGVDADDAQHEAAVAELSARLMAEEPSTVADLARQVVWWQGLHDPVDGGAGEFFPAAPIMRERLGRLASLPGATPAPGAAPEASTEILRLFHRNRALIAAAATHECATANVDEELEELFYRESDALADRIAALPCVGVADFAAKVIVETCAGSLVPDWDTGRLWVEARRLTAMLPKVDAAPIAAGSPPNGGGAGGGTAEDDDEEARAAGDEVLELSSTVLDAFARVRRLAGLVTVAASAAVIDKSAIAELGWTLEERLAAVAADLTRLRDKIAKDGQPMCRKAARLRGDA